MDNLNNPKNTPDGKAKLRLVITVAASIIGSFVGSIPVMVGSVLCDRLVPVLFIIIPVCICLFIHLLGGCHRIRGLISCIVFSVFGLYFVAVVCRTAEYIDEYKMSFSMLPVVAATQIGSVGIMKYIGFNSAYIFPLFFTALGVACSYLTLRRYGND